MLSAFGIVISDWNLADVFGVALQICFTKFQVDLSIQIHIDVTWYYVDILGSMITHVFIMMLFECAWLGWLPAYVLQYGPAVMHSVTMI